MAQRTMPQTSPWRPANAVDSVLVSLRLRTGFDLDDAFEDPPWREPLAEAPRLEERDFDPREVEPDLEVGALVTTVAPTLTPSSPSTA